jgi:hypothetical protein
MLAKPAPTSNPPSNSAPPCNANTTTPKLRTRPDANSCSSTYSTASTTPKHLETKDQHLQSKINSSRYSPIRVKGLDRALSALLADEQVVALALLRRPFEMADPAAGLNGTATIVATHPRLGLTYVVTASLAGDNEQGAL